MMATEIVPNGLDAYEWLQLLALGGFAGALGQGVRAVVGLKKAHDAASTQGVAVGDLVEAHRLINSLVVGAIAGALAAIGIVHDLTQIDAQQILAIATAGYAGTDFIEGFVSRVAPAPGVPAGQEGVGVGAAAPAAAAAGGDDAVG